jgi:alpha-L-fucosidase 2
MLVQSHEGTIHLLPAVPGNLTKGAVSGLRARGGFEVDMTWEDSTLTQVVIRSQNGNPCKVRYKDVIVEYATQPGIVLELNGKLEK